jgi:hypothetical protein
MEKNCIVRTFTIFYSSSNITEVSKVVPGLFLTEHHAMEAYWGSGAIPPLIL